MPLLRTALFSCLLALSLPLGAPPALAQSPPTQSPPTQSPPASVAPDRAAPDSAAQSAPNSVAPNSVASPAPVVADSLSGEVAKLRSAVVGLAARNDSLARRLAARPQRVDTVVVRDTTVRAAAQQAVERVGQEASKAIQNFVPKLVLSVLLLVVALYLLRGLVWLLEAFAARTAERRLFYKRLVPIVRLLVWALAVYLIIAAIFQIPGNNLLAAAAAIGVAVGFAAQEVLKNIFGGIVIILDQPFQVGDKIAVEGTYGEVVSIGLRSTRIVTPDDNLVSVPNAQIVDGQVANANAGELNLQVVTELYLPGWVDVALAKRIAYEAAANSRYVYLNKPIVVIAKDEFKETFLLHLKVKAYVLDTRYEFLLMSDVTEAAKTEFLRHGLLTPVAPLHTYLGLLAEADAPAPGAPSGNGRGTAAADTAAPDAVSSDALPADRPADA